MNKSTTSRQRLLALLLCLVMLLGLLPSTAMAAGTGEPGATDDSTPGISTLAVGDGPYTVTSVQTAVTSTDVGVTLMNTTTESEISDVASVPQDGTKYSIGGNTITLEQMLAGYGMMELEASSPGVTYLFQYATWGPDPNGEPIENITYSELADQTDGLYLWYDDSGEQEIPTKVYMHNEIFDGEPVYPGEIDWRMGQVAAGGGDVDQAFDHAELQPIGADNTGLDPVEIDSVRLINGHYYVTSPTSSSALSPSGSWSSSMWTPMW